MACKHSISFATDSRIWLQTLVVINSESHQVQVRAPAAIWQPLAKAIREHNRRFWQQIDGQAFGAVLRHSLGRSDGQTPTQGDFESAAVAAGRDWLGGLAWGKM